MILCVNLNPCVDKTYFVHDFHIGGHYRVKTVKQIAGGKGNNVARALKKLGIDVMVLNVLGGATGEKIVELLKGENIWTEVLTTKHPTREIVTIADLPSYKQTVLFEPASFDKADVSKLIDQFQEILSKERIEFVVLSGSVPSEALDDIYYVFTTMAHKRSIRVILDTYGTALEASLEAQPDVVRINKKEATGLVRQSGHINLVRMLNHIRDKGVGLIVISDGAEGSVAYWDSMYYEIQSEKIEVINPIGSGDSMVAGIVYGMMNGYETHKLLKFATACAMSNAMVWDAATIDRQVLTQLVDKVELVKLG